MNKKIVLSHYNSNDYSWLYLDGKLLTEGDSINSYEALMELSKCLGYEPEWKDFDVSCKICHGEGCEECEYDGYNEPEEWS